MSGEVVNLTPHEVTVFRGGEVCAKYESRGVVRVRTSSREVEVEGFPHQVSESVLDSESVKRAVQEIARFVKPGSFAIVSTFVGQAIAGSKEAQRLLKGVTVLSPDTYNGVVRDSEERVIGVTRFQVWWKGGENV